MRPNKKLASFPGTDYVLDHEFTDSFDTERHLIYDNIFQSIHNGTQPLASIENSWQQVLAVEKCFLSSKDVIVLPSEFRNTLPVEAEDSAPDKNTIIIDIIPVMQKLYSKGIGFSEAGISWATPSTKITVE